MASRAPRRLTITRAGKCLIAIALAAGLAALNTGNNPLFLAWGMVLGAMVVSGVLSEATLRYLTVALRLPDEARAQTPSHLRARITNTSKYLPALAIEVLVQCEDHTGTQRTLHAPYELRLDAGQSRELYVPFVPQKRGEHRLTGLSVRTAYPFGLFVKERPLALVPLPFVALPAPGAVQPVGRAVVGPDGQQASARAGDGEDYFATRAYRLGDPLKHVLWRRVAKAGRWLVVEREAKNAQRLVLVLQFVAGASPGAVEATLSAAGTLVEQMLGQQLAVGLLAPGVYVPPEADAPGSQRQRRAVLLALAVLQPEAAMPKVGRDSPGGKSPHLHLTAPALVDVGRAGQRLALRLEAAP